VAKNSVLTVAYAPSGDHLIGSRVILAPREGEDPLACILVGDPDADAAVFTVVATDADAGTIDITPEVL